MILAGNHYKGMPDQLLITIDVGKEQFTTLQPDSIQIEWQGRLIRPQAVHYESTVLDPLRHFPWTGAPPARPAANARLPGDPV
jgi:hypothetical protein